MQEENEKKFLSFLNRGEVPFDHERKVFESHFERLLRIYDKKLTPPYEVEIQPSSVCNVDCIWCVGKECPTLPNLLTKKYMKKVCEDIVEFNESGFCVDTIKFSGFVGEPLVNPATIEAIDFLSLHNKRVGLFTNGMLMDNVTSEGSRYIDSISKASYLHVSLDAGSESTMKKLKGPRASFERIMKSLEEVVYQRETQKTRLEIGVGYIITPHNVSEVYPTAKRLKENGVDFIRYKIDITGRYLLDTALEKATEEIEKAKDLKDDKFNVVSIHTGKELKNDFSEILDIHSMGKIKCYTSELWGTVGSDGKLYACDHRTHSNASNYGDLKVQSFRDVWKSRTNNLPDYNCKMCSPFGTRINRFLNFLFGLNREEIVQLHEKYFGGNNSLN